MDKLVIEGGRFLRGPLPVSGSKNAALPLMAAAVLAPGKTTLSNIPDLRDIGTFSRVIEHTGVTPHFDAAANLLTLDATTLDRPVAPYELVSQMRASFYMLGALLGRCGEAHVSLPGGCAWGPRPVDLHLKGLEALGAEIELDQGYVVARAPGGRLKGGTFTFEPSSVGATVNVMLAAVLAEGTTRLENAAVEPDVVVFGQMLKRMGAKIFGLGTRSVEIRGVDALTPVDFTNCPDRIEAGTFMLAAALAGEPGDTIRIAHVNPDHLGDAFLTALSKTGTRFDLGDDWVDVVVPDTIKPVSVETDVYPGFPTDLQAQWSVLMTQATGNSKIRETIYTDRFKHIPELMRMGANAIVIGDEAVIEGKHRATLKGAQVMSTDLRASVSLVMAGMIAEGETHVLRVYHLDRGYENLENKLRAAGLSIRREQYVPYQLEMPETA